MEKPKVGDIIKVKEEVAELFERGRVFEVYDPPLSEWWDTAHGEAKVSLMDALESLDPEKAATAEWYAMIENVDYPGEVMAVASFEVE